MSQLQKEETCLRRLPRCPSTWQHEGLEQSTALQTLLVRLGSHCHPVLQLQKQQHLQPQGT